MDIKKIFAQKNRATARFFGVQWRQATPAVQAYVQTTRCALMLQTTVTGWRVLGVMPKQKQAFVPPIFRTWTGVVQKKHSGKKKLKEIFWEAHRKTPVGLFAFLESFYKEEWQGVELARLVDSFVFCSVLCLFFREGRTFRFPSILYGVSSGAPPCAFKNLWHTIIKQQRGMGNAAPMRVHFFLFQSSWRVSKT